ncbi:efflux RND transporter periplasmic adaptor subunit [uncultured Oscillibacter sp.]|uniref:efflux RND transporter periplasmic adaptor subunit n=1 Tax=uncultured Oscillibacter sp. TaxID=876091 RepID=UPI0025DB3643|nr:efflux RND transporter periplasmic adaptor subunit [uncultured Oscillibacter sp.]
MEKEQLMETAAPQTVPANEKRKKRWHLPGKKGKKRLIALVAAAAVVLAAIRLLPGKQQSAAAVYQSDTVQRRDISVSVTGTATLEPADAYNVTTLLSATILTAPFEEGDLVEKDTLLYTLDSGDARDSVSRANISTQQAQLSYQQAQEALQPTVPISGTIGEVYVRDGESVNAGDQLARIVTSTDITIDFLFIYVSPQDFYVGEPATVFLDGMEGSVQGTVASVSDSTAVTSNGKQGCSVRVKIDNPGAISDSYTASAVIGSYTSYGNASVNMPASAVVYAGSSGTVTGFSKLLGSSVTKGDVLCTIDSESGRTQLENARLSLESARLSASSAQGNLDDYTIKSPISGTVIEKTFKAGDKVDGVTSGNLAVIYDLSCLKMDMSVNELDISKVQVGQTVEITCDAVMGQTFTGTVEKVSVNGTTTGGFTTYPVTISIADYGELRPGMNVSATILCQTDADVLTIPVGAVSRGNTVQVALPGALAEDGVTLADPAKVEQRSVTLGANDDSYIAITSGLEEGETVLYQEEIPQMGG